MEMFDAEKKECSVDSGFAAETHRLPNDKNTNKNQQQRRQMLVKYIVVLYILLYTKIPN